MSFPFKICFSAGSFLPSGFYVLATNKIKIAFLLSTVKRTLNLISMAPSMHFSTLMYKWIEKTASSNFLSLGFTEWCPKKLHIMCYPL